MKRKNIELGFLCYPLSSNILSGTEDTRHVITLGKNFSIVTQEEV